MSTVVKVYLEHREKIELRRFKIDHPNTYPSYEVFKEKLLKLYPILRHEQFSMMWKDEDNEFVTFSSQEEFCDAIDALNSNVFRIYIHLDSGKPKINSQSENFAISHIGVVCDICGMDPIKGNRYKCNVCSDFDLCDECKVLKGHPHDMTKFERPMKNLLCIQGASLEETSLPERDLHKFVRFLERIILLDSVDAVHHDITCAGCKANPIVGIRYKCKLCYDYDLCSDCKLKNKHNHEMFRLESPLQLIPTICSFDEERNIVDTLFAFSEEQEAIDSNAFANASKHAVVHYGSICDFCSMSPIRGVRYKCDVCLDFELCTQCKKSSSHPHAMIEHETYFNNIPFGRNPFSKHDSFLNKTSKDIIIKVEGLPEILNLIASTSSNRTKYKDVYHLGIKCDNCSKTPIEGIRYNCKICRKFDLCRICYTNTLHDHEMFIFETPVSIISYKGSFD